MRYNLQVFHCTKNESCTKIPGFFFSPPPPDPGESRASVLHLWKCFTWVLRSVFHLGSLGTSASLGEKVHQGVNINKKDVSVFFSTFCMAWVELFLKLPCFGKKKGFFRRREGFWAEKTWSHCQPRVDLRQLVPKTLMLCDFQMEGSSTSLKRLSDSEVTEKTWRKVRNYRLRVIMSGTIDMVAGRRGQKWEKRRVGLQHFARTWKIFHIYTWFYSFQYCKCSAWSKMFDCAKMVLDLLCKNNFLKNGHFFIIV